MQKYKESNTKFKYTSDCNDKILNQFLKHHIDQVSGSELSSCRLAFCFSSSLQVYKKS